MPFRNLDGNRPPGSVLLLVRRRVGDQVAIVRIIRYLPGDSNELCVAPGEEHPSAAPGCQLAKRALTAQGNAHQAADRQPVHRDTRGLSLLDHFVKRALAVLVEAVCHEDDDATALSVFEQPHGGGYG